MNAFKLLTLAILLAGVAVAGTAPGAYGQATSDSLVPAPEPRQSPMALAATRLDDDAYVKVVYGSPRMRGRTIFGGLVPFENVWRTGANEATELTFTSAVSFAGEQVEAGTYAMFTVPREDEWTIVLNSGLGQWGAYEYNEDLDLLRVDVPVEDAGATHEAFTIRFDEADGGSDMVMVWERTLVRVPIRSL